LARTPRKKLGFVDAAYGGLILPKKIHILATGSQEEYASLMVVSWSGVVMLL